ncbi:hypothetical protein LBMAG53_08090 [Planctomycetota bacterium]|nr:hypothetical protein LBMAG53_08090 [Planctomycetota bacterium]
MALHDSTLHVAVSSSVRLRDQMVADLLAGWEGPVRRLIEPDGLDRIIIGLDTPSFFEPAAALVVRCDDRWIKRHRDLLTPLIGRKAGGGVLILSTAAVEAGPGSRAFTKSLEKTGVLHHVAVPEGRALAGWLADRISQGGHPVTQAMAVANALCNHVGEDADALLSALDVAIAYAGDEPLSESTVEAVVGGNAARPTWEFAGALVEGKADQAYKLLAAGGGLEPHLAVAAVLGELRKLLACTESRDNAQAASWAGVRNPNAMLYARRRADALGRGALLREMRATIHAQQQLRTSGSDPVVAVEQLVLHARLIARPPAERVPGGAS